MNSSIILALETATDACSVALIKDDRCISRLSLIPKMHTSLILPMISELLAEAEIGIQEITAIACGRGPGSFTGVRIAISVAQGLSYGLQVPVYPISTLHALAWQAKKSQASKNGFGYIVPALDARMNEIYVSCYELNSIGLIESFPEKLIDGKTAFDILRLSTQKNLHLIGSGWDVYASTHNALAKQCHPHAQDIAEIALEKINAGLKGLPADKVLPVYLRDNVAVKMASYNSESLSNSSTEIHSST